MAYDSKYLDRMLNYMEGIYSPAEGHVGQDMVLWLR